MATDEKLINMLTEYAAAHQHPTNILMHIIGIPIIMLGVFIPLTWYSFEIYNIQISLAESIIFGFFVFYLSLDILFAFVFLIFAFLILFFAKILGNYPGDLSLYFGPLFLIGGYIGQFIGHGIEKSKPVLIKHPIQAHLAAPFFIVVELFKILGLREKLFDEVQSRIKN